MRRSHAVSLFLFLGLISLALLVKAAVLQVPTGTWAPTANLADARANSSAALLSDGSEHRLRQRLPGPELPR